MNESTNDYQGSRGGVNQSIAIPVAIIIGFGLIAASIYFSGGKTSEVSGQEAALAKATQNLSQVAPVTESDHYRGNPNAKLVIVEYSDFDCPFCKSFHATMQRIIEEYGPSANVAWVYRHFPLTNLHPSANYIAEASECVAEIGGNDAFWKFADLVFGERAVNEPTNISRLPEFAEIAGVDPKAYESCVASGRSKAKVEEDRANAMATGGQGTPHSIILIGDQTLPIDGAQPYEVVKQMIDGLLSQ